MYVLGIAGSPRKKGNTDYLLSLFLKQAGAAGYDTGLLEPNVNRYTPCIGCGYCEKHGVCSIDNSLETGVFPLLRQADIIVLASPVYFYGIPAWTKAMIDRSQTLWSRKYRFGLKDPGHDFRRGVLLCSGATHGKDLFDGIRLTARYFFDAVGAGFQDALYFRGMDRSGDLMARQGTQSEVAAFAERIFSPFGSRKKVMFLCRDGAVLGPMAHAFARSLAGDRLDAVWAGCESGGSVNQAVVAAMAEKHLDLSFINSRPAEAAVGKQPPDLVVTLGCEASLPWLISPSSVEHWNVAQPADDSLEEIRRVRDDLEQKVRDMISRVC
ncbi:MAG: NAD(P)H-dependent oxidoreductase [Pseudomonadota bacterium]